jgi:4-hydroxy-tetrahydrodipicolinate reductase
MKIALLGAGRMGQEIARLLPTSGHTVAWQIDRLEGEEALPPSDVVIEFTHPSVVAAHLQRLLAEGRTVVCGTTGWAYDPADFTAVCKANSARLLHANNFSLGVLLFRKAVQALAVAMNRHTAYDVYLEERHHRLKADAPSGTANEIAQEVITALDRKTHIATNSAFANLPIDSSGLSVASTRAGAIVGEHRLVFTSAHDSITMAHTAHSRDGFALGAISAAEWLVGQPPGVHRLEAMLA